MNSAALCLADVEKISVGIDELFLDVNNPRFYGETDLQLFNANDVFDLKNQEIIRQYILKKYAASEIIESILEVGFIPVDLIVVEEKEGRLIVIEGNRRVTALKTIFGNIERKEISVSQEIYKSVSHFEALKIRSKNGSGELKKWILQGIRHVSGVRGWGPYQQAMLIYELHYAHGLKFKDIGKTIGIHFNRVSTMLRAYLGILQMKKFEKYKDKAHGNLFSHFEQAYIKKQIREWLGWNDDAREYTNHENLFKFYDLIIGNGDEPLIMSKNIRDDLPEIYEDKSLFADVMNKKITVEEARGKLSKIEDDQKLTHALKVCIGILRETVAAGIINDEDRLLIAELNRIVTK